MTSTIWCRGLRGSVTAVALAAAFAASGQARAGQGAGDFNGDGFDDLAIGVVDESVLNDVGITKMGAGAVNVIYGTKKGLRATNNRLWHQGNIVGPESDVPEDFDRFGWALAVGDFNNDGKDDLAIGVPNEGMDTIGASAGVVQVLYGSDAGLDITLINAQHWALWVNLSQTPEAGDQFGWALAAGDFNGDGVDDLAISAPGENAGTTSNAGAVQVLYGKAGVGLSDEHVNADGTLNTELSPDNQFFTQGLLGDDMEGEEFGRALTAGDFNGDGIDDLAVGAPFEDLEFLSDTVFSAGAVNVIYGSDAGLTTSGVRAQFWNQRTEGIHNLEVDAEDGDWFGFALAAGDFDRDGYEDLAVGVPFESVLDRAGSTVEDAGAVNVIYGSETGLTASGSQFWHQNKKGVKEVAEPGDRFGITLAAGDFGRSRHDDLAIGVPLESVGKRARAGAVNVLYGTKKGLKSKGSQLWHQNKKGIAEKAEAGDLFGISLSVGRFNKGGHYDLAIGVAGEDLSDGAGGSIVDAGAVNVIYGAKKGLSAKRDQLWHQDKTGVEDDAEAGDSFGRALPGSPGLR